MGHFRWAYLDADGAPLTPDQAPTDPFPTQAEAEAWMGESWHHLVEAGVEAVVLWDGEDEVYGPMSLKPMS